MTNQKKSRLPVRKKIAFAALVVVAFFSVVELGFRTVEHFRPPRHVDFGLGFNADSRVFRSMVRRPGMLETDPAKRVSFVRQRFQTPKPDGTFRIVALGGSSVNYLEPEFRALEKKLTCDYANQFDQIEIINCGGFAYGSHRLVIVFREMLEYSPDLLLLYTGHNEFEEIEQLNLSSIERLAFDRVISRSAFIRFVRDRKADYDLSQLEKEHNQRVLACEEPVSESNFARAWSYQFTEDDVKKRMKTYEHNVTLILQMAKEQDVPVVLGTVPSNLARPYLPQESAKRYEDVYKLWETGAVDQGNELAKEILVGTVGRHQSSCLENNILRGLATNLSVPLVDIESLVMAAEPHGIPGETMFDDHCHLSSRGREVWSSGFEPEIRAAVEAAFVQ
ncbi:SGNH/GDSL hydrolase family protein [Stieleria marina]|uniref:SGNH hydrolase-type esterase domain-containing protein n=1 Tax=Stieleria marina TaxID=1930275 RepID=A0A517P0C3_9BACT|nr:hypothetical protein K239x_48330 [Planctomycetes bacterium K23_9]